VICVRHKGVAPVAQSVGFQVVHEVCPVAFDLPCGEEGRE
jgi:hypothetical protein